MNLNVGVGNPLYLSRSISYNKHMGQYIRHARLLLDEVMPEIMANWDSPRRTRLTVSTGHNVGITSLRLRTFCRMAYTPKGIKCVSCGLVPNFFAVESFAGCQIDSPHVNLYGMKDDKEVLFTHDHKLARALGGGDNLNNTQVMCAPCNSKKSIGEGKLVKFKRENKC
jgi:hypothetical protein